MKMIMVLAVVSWEIRLTRRDGDNVALDTCAFSSSKGAQQPLEHFPIDDVMGFAMNLH